MKTENNQSTRPSYGETRHQIDLEREELPNTQSTPSQKGDWQNVEQLQTQQIFESNMSLRSNPPSQPPVIDSFHSSTPPDYPTPSTSLTTISSTTLPTELFFRTHVPTPQPQRPPPSLPPPPPQFESSWSHVQALQNQQILEKITQPRGIISPTPVKEYPSGDRTVSKIPTWLRFFANPEMTSLDPQERIDNNTIILTTHTKDLAHKIGEVVDELRSFGCTNARFKDGNLTLRFDRTISNRLDALMEQHFPQIAIPNVQYLEMEVSIGNDLVLNTLIAPFFARRLPAKPNPLSDRALVYTKEYTLELSLFEKTANKMAQSGPNFTNHLSLNTRMVASTPETFITWVEKGKTHIVSMADMSCSGMQRDKGLLSKAGRKNQVNQALLFQHQVEHRKR